MDTKACFLYRLADTDVVISASARNVTHSIMDRGFAIRRFDPSAPILYIPAETPYMPGTLDSLIKETLPIDFNATSKDDYISEVQNIIDAENAGVVKKVVAARNLVYEQRYSVEEVFYKLCDRYPEAFVFAFYTPESGCWIGASPELLLMNTTEVVESVALAGTRRIKTEGKWDNKNLHEQKLVADYIVDKFRSSGLSPEVVGPFTQQAGNIEHLKSRIISNTTCDREFLLNLACSLSPTPALCGLPQNKAYEIIKGNEKNDRLYYGGFCGPVQNNEIALYVNLRSAKVCSNKIILFAGGGIMPDSIPEEEWMETEIKLQTLLKVIEQ